MASSSSRIRQLQGVKQWLSVNPHLRILCLDVGMSKVGVAISNPGNRTCIPLTVLIRHNSFKTSGPEKLGVRFEKLVREVHQLVDSHDIGAIVVGVPVNPRVRDERNSAIVRIKKFADALAAVELPKMGNFTSSFRNISMGTMPPLKMKVPIVYWDESFSTRRAVHEIVSTYSKRQMKEAAVNVDAFAAAQILDSFLHAFNNPE